MRTPARTTLAVTSAVLLTAGLAGTASAGKPAPQPPPAAAELRGLVYTLGETTSADLATVDADGTRGSVLPSSQKATSTYNSTVNDSNPYFSSDGSLLALSSRRARSGDSDVYVVDTVTGAVRNLTPRSTVQDVPIGFVGTDVVFLRGSTASWQVLRVPAGGGSAVALSPGALGIGRAAVNDAGTLVISADFDGDGARSIYRATLGAAGSLTATSFTAVTSPAGPGEELSPAIAQDGRIAYAAQNPLGVGDLFLISADGSTTTPLAATGELASNPAFDAGGTRVTYASRRSADDVTQVWVKTIGDDASERQATDGAVVASTPVWNPKAAPAA